MASSGNVLSPNDAIFPVVVQAPGSPSVSAESRSIESAPTAATAASVATQSWSRRAVIREAIAIWAATRVAYALLTYLTVTLMTAVRASSGIAIGYPQGYIAHTADEFVNAWMRWDALWYVNIAQHGYSGDQATAFFPLFPLLIKLVSFFTGSNWALAGVIAGNLGTLAAFIGIGLLTARELNARGASSLALRIFAAYPLAFFLAAPYTDGMFIGWAALALYSAREGNWTWAAVWSFLAGLTRPTGVILILPLLWEYGRYHGWWAKERWNAIRDQLARGTLGVQWTSVQTWLRERMSPEASGARDIFDFGLLVAAVPLALAVFAVICKLSVGHFLTFLHAQQIYWNRVNTPIWHTVKSAVELVFTLPTFSFWQMRLLVDLGPLVLFTALTLVVFRRQPFAFTLYMLGLIYLTIASPVAVRLEPDPLFSAGRFFTAAVPMFVLLTGWSKDRTWLETLLLSCGFMAQALLGAYFLTGGWIV